MICFKQRDTTIRRCDNRRDQIAASCSLAQRCTVPICSVRASHTGSLDHSENQTAIHHELVRAHQRPEKMRAPLRTWDKPCSTMHSFAPNTSWWWVQGPQPILVSRPSENGIAIVPKRPGCTAGTLVPAKAAKQSIEAKASKDSNASFGSRDIADTDQRCIFCFARN